MNEADRREIEVKFLNVDVGVLTERMKRIKAKDKGEDTLREIVFYDSGLKWKKENKFARIRSTSSGILMTYKKSDETTVDGTIEIELAIDSTERGKAFLEAVGLVAYREQEKRRRSFIMRNVMADLDTWPGVPTYLELEGPSEDALKEAAESLNLDWSKRELGTASRVIQDIYNIPVKSYRHFTFSKIE